MTCKHIFSSDEGTSHCTLAGVTAEQWQAMKTELSQLKQENAALKGELKITDLPSELAGRTKLEEWQACYASLFNKLNPVMEEITQLRAEREGLKEYIRNDEALGKLYGIKELFIGTIDEYGNHLTQTKQSEAVVSDLLPCPFCGSSDVQLDEWSMCNDSVKCNNCWAWGPIFKEFDGGAKAIKAWNTRYKPTKSEGADAVD